MRYDFDSIIPRRGTGCIKYDRRPELDPFWVADMDFASAPEIIAALHTRVDHGIFGYAQPHEGLHEAAHEYLLQRHGYSSNPSEIIYLGGLVPALSLAARAFCKPGEAVMTCTPVYPPFLSVHHDAHAELVEVPHAQVENRWTFDWNEMERAVTAKTKIFLLCNPQNPLGRAFSSDEITQVARFCERHDLILVSDEIHCDLVLDESATPHHSALRLPPELLARTITLLSPSKTYNIAGLGLALAVIPDDSLRRRFSAARGHTLAEINALSYYAAEAAYRHGEPWRQELLNYLRGNQQALIGHLQQYAPELIISHSEATYLTWIDCRALPWENPANSFEAAGLFLSDGAFFHRPQHVRFNFGCPRSRVLEGAEKMIRAIRG